MVFKIVIVGSNPASLVCFSFMLNSFFYLVLKVLNNSFLNFFKFKNLTFAQLGQQKLILELSNIKYHITDFVIVYLYSIYFNNFKKNTFKDVRFQTRIKQLVSGYFINFKGSVKNITTINGLFSGLSYFWQAIRYWVFALVLAVVLMYYFIVIKLLPFNKIFFQWFMLSMFFYWLMSGFVFFIKRYNYAKYTSAIQRFWRRSYILFWLIESCVFLVFLYLTLNANQEPVYMYDYIQIYKTHLFSWRYFLLKILPLTLLIFLGYFLTLSIKWQVFSKLRLVLVVMTLLIVYFAWLEFYQVFHLVQFYGNLNWIYDTDEHFWNLEVEFRRTRIVNHYVMICFLAKFFHVLFILIFWVFFVLRVNELGRVRYPLLSANLQNFIFLYIMSWLYMYPWLKFYLRRYLDYSYYWFYLHIHQIGIKIFFNDLKLFYFSLFSNIKIFFGSSLNKFTQLYFFYWHESTTLTNYSQFVKHNIRDKIIFFLN